MPSIVLATKGIKKSRDSTYWPKIQGQMDKKL